MWIAITSTPGVMRSLESHLAKMFLMRLNAFSEAANIVAPAFPPDNSMDYSGRVCASPVLTRVKTWVKLMT